MHSTGLQDTKGMSPEQHAMERSIENDTLRMPTDLSITMIMCISLLDQTYAHH